MFEERYYIYSAFEKFLQHCVCYEQCHAEALRDFESETLKSDFLFGPEVGRYRRQVVANAIALRGIREGLPCEDRPVIGGIVGYFKGSTNLKTIEEIQAWFTKQIFAPNELRAYFAPYLDYGMAGVDTKLIRMTPPNLPEPIPARRRTKH